MDLDSQFWIGLVQIIWIDLLLSGDNAVVIALACRRLPPHQRRWGIILGSGAAIGLRFLFAAFIIFLLAVPYLKLVGALLLLWIAVKLVLPEADDDHENIEEANNLWAAVRTIVIADAVMSLDNVIGIAAAAKGDHVLIILGLLISIPLIIFGSALLLRLLDRYPQIAYIGGALLGYIAGDIVLTDPALVPYVEPLLGDGGSMPWLTWVVPIAGAAFVMVLGGFLKRRMLSRSEAVS
ncbi:MAG: TerC family protein [Pseudomonadota bacterium]